MRHSRITPTNQQPVTSNIPLGRLHNLRYSAFINAFAVAFENNAVIHALFDDGRRQC